MLFDHFDIIRVDRISQDPGPGALGRLDHQRHRRIAEDEVAVALAPVHVAGRELGDHRQRALGLAELDRLRRQLGGAGRRRAAERMSKP